MKLPPKVSAGRPIEAKHHNLLVDYMHSITPMGSPSIKVKRLASGSTFKCVKKHGGSVASSPASSSHSWKVIKVDDTNIKVLGADTDGVDHANIVIIGDESLTIYTTQIEITDNCYICVQVTWDDVEETYVAEYITQSVLALDVDKWIFPIAYVNCLDSKVSKIQQYAKDVLQVAGRFI